MIPYARHAITDEDKKAVMDCLDSDWIAGNGKIVREFEEAIAHYTGYKYAIAVNSATSGLRVAYQTGLDWGFVEIPALTFVATYNMLVPTRDKRNIVIRDVNHTLVRDGMDVGVSYAGYPVHNCMIADDAHYLYPTYQSQRNNIISVISCHPAKHITTGEGGVVLTNEELFYREMASLVDQGRGTRNEFGFGYNFRMPSLNAALGLSQLKRAAENLKWRTQIAIEYTEAFKDIPEIVTPPNHKYHSWHLYVIRLRGIDRDWFREYLFKRNIGTQVHYPPLYHYSHIPKKYDCPITEGIWNNGVSIPMFSGLTEENISHIIETIKKAIDEYSSNNSRKRE